MKELDIVKLKKNYEDLIAGTEGTIVLDYDGNTFEVEFMDENNNTIGVYTIEKKYLELIESFKK